MLTHERKAYLLRHLANDGRIVAKSISPILGVSHDTIRRDLRELAKEGLLRRVHGGAVPIAKASLPYDIREDIASPEKAAIGRHAAHMIEPGQVVFLDGGTTAVQVAQSLPTDLKATIITHSPIVAIQLVRCPDLEIEIIGGRLYRHSIVACGSVAMEWIDRFRPDLSLIGATGLHPQIGITTNDGEEAQIKRGIITRSGETLILASSEKFGAASAYKLADWADVDGCIVPGNIADTTHDLFGHLDCEFHFAPVR